MGSHQPAAPCQVTSRCPWLLSRLVGSGCPDPRLVVAFSAGQVSVHKQLGGALHQGLTESIATCGPCSPKLCRTRCNALWRACAAHASPKTHKVGRHLVPVEAVPRSAQVLEPCTSQIRCESKHCARKSGSQGLFPQVSCGCQPSSVSIYSPWSVGARFSREQLPVTKRRCPCWKA